MNKESLKQIFIDCAFYGYTEGVKAMLAADRTFGEDTWMEALKGAAIGGNSEVVRFILNQYVLQKRDIVVDTEWLRMLDEKVPDVAREVDVCDRYVRAEKMRSKLKAFGIDAPGVSMPDFIDQSAKVYEFVEMPDDQGSTDSARNGGAVFAQADQFGKSVPRPGGRTTDAAAVESWLAQTKRGA